MTSLQVHLFHSASGLIILLLVSSLTMAQSERHKQVAAANMHCEIECLNGGYCSFTKYTDYPQKGDVGYYQACTCRPGFGGGGCEKVIAECQAPQFQCHNGAPCENQEDGSLGCDCSYADDKSELAGYMCRRPVMQECDTLDENNKSYCTNGGICLSSMTASSKHLMFSIPNTHQGCKCDDPFTGDHCEYLKDMPESSLVEKPSGESAGAKAGITLSVLAALAILGVAFVVRRKRQQLRVRMGQSWKNGEQRFREFYEERCVPKDNMARRGSGAEEDEEEISFSDESDEGKDVDLQSMLSSVGDESEVHESKLSSGFV